MQSISAFDQDIYNVSDVLSLQLNGSSKGNQRKWLIDNKFVKEQFWYQGKYWRDDLVEVIASKIGKYFHYPTVEQKSCKIVDNGRQTYGVVSENFCNPGERFISFNRLLKINNIDFDSHDPYDYKFNRCLDIMQSITGLECSEYLKSMIILDYLVGNEDRHLNNFGVLCSTSGNYRLAPLFDFGLGLFEHDERYSFKTFRECIEMMIMKPFSENGELIADYVVDSGFHLPETIDLTNVEIPSLKAGSYLRNRCMHLGIKLIGVD